MLNNQPQMHLKLLQKSNSKTTEVTNDLIDNKITNKITRKSPQNFAETVESETEIPNERYNSPEEKKQVIDGLRLIR